MAKLKIVKEGDEILRKRSREVTEITPKILTLLDDMAETMRLADGCGLAAVQVGILRRIVVIEVEQGKLIELINPKIIAFSGEQDDYEGCLSVPDRQGKVKRPMYVTVRGMNRHGETVEINGSKLLARAICHELDHLDGKLFIDRATELAYRKR
ncbi:MAG: peptide deformylase [Clostridia bacterium]|nr:peptide deformylase [Clostridia bacterium]